MNKCELARRLHAQCVNCDNLYHCRTENWAIEQDECGGCEFFIRKGIKMDTPYYLVEIAKERKRQDEKWGEQSHHPLMWFSIIGEEYGEMCKAFNEYSLATANDSYIHLEEMQKESCAYCGMLCSNARMH